MEKQLDNEKGLKCIDIVKLLLFVSIGILLFVIVSSVLVQAGNYPDSSSNASYAFSTFYDLPENSQDVIFLGSSHVQYGVSPMHIYNETGIVSYNLGCPVEPAEGSYFLLRETFKRQKPKVVMFDVSSLYIVPETREQFVDGMRYVLDTMPFSADKIEAARVYADCNYDNQDAYFLSALLPVTLYHDRWENIHIADILNIFDRGDFYGAGYVMQTSTEEAIEESSAYCYEVPDESFECLKKMKQLCEENDCELVLLKIPCVGDPKTQIYAWTKLRSDAVKDKARELDLPYLDFVYDIETDIDFKMDTRDEGSHLNHSGAKKLSSYLGNYLKDTYGIESKNNEIYDKWFKVYEKKDNIATLQATEE